MEASPDLLVLRAIDIRQAARRLAGRVAGFVRHNHPVVLYGIPRGGIPAAYALQAELTAQHRRSSFVTDLPETADYIVDDLVDSGATAQRYEREYKKPVVALFRKESSPPHVAEAVGTILPDKWVTFPWEQGEVNTSAHDIFTRLLQYVGENPSRGGLLDTPERAAAAWDFWTRGYDEDPAEVLKVFEDGGERYDQMVCVRDIPLYSHCEHHLAPIFGVAHVAYVPNGRIVGLSKLNRLVDVFARRLQVQERLTDQIAQALDEHVKPKGVAVTLECRHLCMESRGVCQQGHTTVTTALRGLFRDDPAAKQEFLDTISRTKG